MNIKIPEFALVVLIRANFVWRFILIIDEIVGAPSQMGIFEIDSDKGTI